MAKVKQSKNRKTKAQMRVAIAKDVLKHIATRKIRVESGSYLELERNQLRAIEQSANDDPTSTSTAVLKNCSVCAIGAMFVTAFNVHDGLTNNELLSTAVGGWRLGQFERGMLEYLSQWFTVKQLRLMEAAFETAGVNGSSLTTTQYIKARRFQVAEASKMTKSERLALDDRLGVYKSRRTLAIERRAERKLLEAIMQNVIEHDGTFKP